MTATLDIAIGLVFVYRIEPACERAASVRALLSYRAYYLQQGIEKLLLGGDTHSEGSVDTPYQVALYPVVVGKAGNRYGNGCAIWRASLNSNDNSSSRSSISSRSRHVPAIAGITPSPGTVEGRR